MRKNIFLIAIVLLLGCKEEAKEIKEINSSMVLKKFRPSKEIKKIKQKQERLKKFYEVFNDGAKIAPTGKPLVLVFGQPNDPYTIKLQEDIINNKKLSSKLTTLTTPYYIDATKNRMHKFMHNNELLDVDTKTLVSIYAINSTPTIIFLDSNAKSIFKVPGYMPPKQFIITLDFINSGKWINKNRKNGEIYEELKKFYIANKIPIKDKK